MVFVGVGEDDKPPEGYLRPPDTGGIAPLLMRAQSLGIPSVLEDAWGPVCVGWSAAWNQSFKG